MGDGSTRQQRIWHDGFAIPVLLAAMAIGGCASLGGGDDSDQTRISGSDRIGARRDVTTGVPRESELVGEGVGELSYKARDDGRVYLWDDADKQLLYSTPVRKGQRFTIAPSDDRATLDKKVVYDGNMRSGHSHKLYFLAK